MLLDTVADTFKILQAAGFETTKLVASCSSRRWP
jgi:hypothetical protein